MWEFYGTFLSFVELCIIKYHPPPKIHSCMQNILLRISFVFHWRKMMNNVTMLTIDDNVNSNIRFCLHRCGSAWPCPRILVSWDNRGGASSSRLPARQPALCYHGDREQRYWWRGEYCVSLKWTSNLWLLLKQNIWTWICNLRFGPGSDPTPYFVFFLFFL